MSTRKIIDPKQNGEKVWLKGHAKAIYMSDGSTVEDAINNIGDIDLKDYAKLEDIPEIPSLNGYATEQWIEDKNYLTEHLDISHLASKLELNSGLLSKQDTLTSGTTIKTINGESILGEGDLTVEGGAKVYTWNWDGESESVTLSQEEYDNIVEADLVIVNCGGIMSIPVSKTGKEFSEIWGGYSLIGQLDLPEGKMYISINIDISTKLAILTTEELNIPTKVSQLENDVPYALKSDVEVEMPNGVYAVDANGKLIDYNSADATALGVALVAGEHKFMIAKSDATDGSNSTLYWTKSYSDLSLTNYGSADGTYGSGYLPKPDGTYQSSPKLSDEFTTWTNGALSDFNGKANTAGIAEASSYAKDMCTVLKTFNQTEQAAGRNSDWYIPALGQLALMYLNMTEINAALAKIGGTALAAVSYWSSSESSSNYAWGVNFSSGSVDYSNFKDSTGRVRFVRDISVSKPLKERVSELESSKQDIIEDLDAIRDGASKGATALQEEQYKGTVTSVTAGNGLTGGSIIDSGTISMPSVITAGTKGNSNSIQLIPSKPNCSATNASGKVIGSITVDEFGRVVDIKECFIDLKTIYPKEVTTSYSGLMTASDKSKLNQCITSSTASTTYATKTSLNNKQDKLVSGTSIKTINGESILGSGDIVIEGGSSSGGGGAYAEVNHGTGDTTFILTPNTFHVWDEVASLDLSFADETAGVANEYLFQFTSGATATTLTLPDVKWASEPTITENMIYQVSVLKGLGSVLAFDNGSALVDNVASISNGMMRCTVTFQYPVASDLVVKVRSGDGPASGTIMSGSSSLELELLGPGAASIESVEPTSDEMYNYIF